MTLTAEKAVKHIIKMEQGVLYMKLRESFNTTTMQIDCTLAQISREGVRIIIAKSKDLSDVTFTTEEMGLLEEGRLIVERFWESDPLAKRHVLLECGHTEDWDEWNERIKSYSSTPEYYMYTQPQEGTFYCWECERDMRAHRFNEKDFAEEVSTHE
jgi:hypothetical protein